MFLGRVDTLCNVYVYLLPKWFIQTVLMESFRLVPKRVSRTICSNFIVKFGSSGCFWALFGLILGDFCPVKPQIALKSVLKWLV